MPQSVIEERGIGKKDCAMRMMIGAGLIALLLVACGPRDPLVVKQFTVRETDPNWSQDLMVRGEVQKRLYGAVEQADREKRKGQYYSVRWRAPKGSAPVSIRFQYRQAVTGSRIHELVQTVSADRGTGVVEFAIAGDVYMTGGRVTAWRMELTQNETVLGEQRSFLWE